MTLNRLTWFGLIPTLAIVSILYLSAVLRMLLIPMQKKMNRPRVERIAIHHNLVARGKGAPS